MAEALKPGQRHPTPTPGVGDRVFYETLLRQQPDSVMAQEWCVAYGVLSEDEAEKLNEKVVSRQKRMRDGVGSPPPPPAKKRKQMASKPAQPHTKISISENVPDEIWSLILGFAQPFMECGRWQWADTIGLTCKAFLRVARDLVPASLKLDDFDLGCGIDLRSSILSSFSASKWKRARLVELHVGWRSILSYDRVKGGLELDEDILAALKRLLSTSRSLPRLEWLDISTMSDHVMNYPLVDAGILQAMPSALPSLKKLCLAGCFPECRDRDEVTPVQFGRFAQELKKSKIESLSFAQVSWMTDEHVAAALPVVGCDLIRLEFIDCSLFIIDPNSEDFEVVADEQLTDATMEIIARECRGLKSLSITGTNITSSGLAKILKANHGLRTLDLSGNHTHRGLSGGADVIATHAPQLVTLRNYWGGPESWLDDEGIKKIVDSQRMVSKEKRISLQTIGICSDDALTDKGLSYALERGVSTIEAEDTPPPFHNPQPHISVARLRSEFPDARFVGPAYPNYVDGSQCNCALYVG